MLPEPTRRTWIYVHPPAIYEISCNECDGRNIEWSEYAGMIWCYDCEIDTRGNPGVFDGPIGIGVLELLGISLDRIDLETGQRMRPVKREGRMVWEMVGG